MKDVLQPPIGEPNRLEKWDQEKNLLLVETQERLDLRLLEEIKIQIAQGSIIVEGSEEENPFLTTRLLVSAPTEEEAKKFLSNGKFEIKNEQGLLSVDAISRLHFSETGTVIQRGRNLIVIGNLTNVTGVAIRSDEVWINGQRVYPNSSETQSIPSMQCEVVLRVPRFNQLKFDLKTQSGKILVEGVSGKLQITTSNAEAEISDFTGDADIETQSGDITIHKLSGNLKLTSASGDVEITNFAGTASLVTKSGEVNFVMSTFEGPQNNIRTASGKIRVNVANESLAIQAETKSGKIRTPHSKEFVITSEEKPQKEGQTFRTVSNIVIASGAGVISVGNSGEKTRIQGRFGQVEEPESKLTLGTKSGDIIIS